MEDLRQQLYKAILMLLLLVYKPSETYKNVVKFRQNNFCANHAMGEFVADPYDCRLFYWCGENGEAVSASCPPNMLFNVQSKLCDTTANVRCKQITLMPPAATQSSTETSLFTVQQYCRNAYEQQPNSESLIFLAHSSKCNQYYMCYYGQALLQECSTDLQWNSRIGKCDLPANVKCPTASGTSAFSLTTTELPPNGGGINIMCPSYGQHIFPHMQRCNMFIYCVKGHSILQQCPFYKHFDVESGRCNWRNKALCIKNLKLEFRKNTFGILK